MRTRSEIALYLLNHKRAHLRALEERFRIVIMVNADATVEGQISFVIEKGSVVGLLGPNGAGKTTCIDMLLGSTIPNAGVIEYFGVDFGFVSM